MTFITIQSEVLIVTRNIFSQLLLKSNSARATGKYNFHLELSQGTCRLKFEDGQGWWTKTSDALYHGNRYWFHIFRNATSPEQWFLQIDMVGVCRSLELTLVVCVKFQPHYANPNWSLECGRNDDNYFLQFWPYACTNLHVQCKNFKCLIIINVFENTLSFTDSLCNPLSTFTQVCKTFHSDNFWVELFLFNSWISVTINARCTCISSCHKIIIQLSFDPPSLSYS